MAWTDDQTTLLLNLAESGLSATEIKKRFSAKDSRKVAELLRLHGVPRKQPDWTPAEDEEIAAALAAGMSWRDLHRSGRLPLRSGNAIRTRLASQKILNDKASAVPALNDADAILRERWPKGTPIDEIAKLLPGMTGKQLQDRAHRLKLKRPQSDSWSPAAIAVLAAEYPRGTPFGEIADRLPQFTAEQIRRQIRKLRLSRPAGFLSASASRARTGKAAGNQGA